MPAEMPGAETEAVQGAIWAMVRLYSSRSAFAQWSAASGVLISQPAFDLLGRVEERGPLTLSELGRLAHMDPSAVGRQVRMLEQLGLLDRTPDAFDRRLVRVTLTARGKEVRRRVAAIGSEHLAQVLNGWPTGDRRALASLLPRLVAELRARRYPSADEGDGPHEVLPGSAPPDRPRTQSRTSTTGRRANRP